MPSRVCHYLSDLLQCSPRSPTPVGFLAKHLHHTWLTAKLWIKLHLWRMPWTSLDNLGCYVPQSQRCQSLVGDSESIVAQTVLQSASRAPTTLVRSQSISEIFRVIEFPFVFWLPVGSLVCQDTHFTGDSSAASLRKMVTRPMARRPRGIIKLCQCLITSVWWVWSQSLKLLGADHALALYLYFILYYILLNYIILNIILEYFKLY